MDKEFSKVIMIHQPNEEAKGFLLGHLPPVS
jgi:hypothetical protein